MRALTRLASVSIACAGMVAGAVLGVTDAAAADAVSVVVVKEHAVGSTDQAQPFLDQLMAVTAKENGWSGAKGRFFTRRDDARSWIDAEKPHYGILSLAPFLAFKQAYGVEAIGQALVTGGGGEQYFVVSKAAGDIGACKGKRLASDHVDDERFINNVVFAKAFKLADFTVDKVTRTGQAGRKVVSDEAECALIDDAQLAALAKVDGGAAVHPVWSSAKLPSMIIVAFPNAPAAERTAFQASLPRLCQASGQQSCSQVGLQALQSKPASDFAGIVSLY